MRWIWRKFLNKQLIYIQLFNLQVVENLVFSFHSKTAKHVLISILTSIIFGLQYIMTNLKLVFILIKVSNFYLKWSLSFIIRSQYLLFSPSNSIHKKSAVFILSRKNAKLSDVPLLRRMLCNTFFLYIQMPFNSKKANLMTNRKRNRQVSPSDKRSSLTFLNGIITFLRHIMLQSYFFEEFCSFSKLGRRPSDLI